MPRGLNAFSGKFIRPFAFGASGESDEIPLLNALREKNYPRAYQQLKWLEKPLEGEAAGRCLTEALSCTVNLFEAVLDACAPGEYVCQVQWRNENICAFVHLEGTILTLAAGMNRVEHMKRLLERGYSVNGDSIRAIEAMEKAFGLNLDPDRLPKGRLSIGEEEHNWYWGRNILNPELVIPDCSPLAAAIACGSIEAVRLLMGSPGIRLADSPSVCQAALAVSDGLLTQCGCVRECFGLTERFHNVREELLEKWELAPDAYIEACTLREFGEELKRRRLSPEKAGELARRLSAKSRLDALRKLKQLMRHYPEACGAGEVRHNVLQNFVESVTPQKPQEERLRVWKKLCGPVRDITTLSMDHYPAEPFKDVKQMERLLIRMAEGGELRADAESAWLSVLDTVTKLRCVMKHVKMTRNTGQGISNLAMKIISMKNMRLLREAEALGILDSEPRRELLAYAIENGADSAFRASVLSLRREAADRAVNGNPVRGCFWSSRWVKASLEEKVAWLRECWDAPLDRAACRERVETFLYDDGFDVNLWEFGIDPAIKLADAGLEFWDLQAAACCGHNPALLEVMLDNGLADRTHRVQWTRGENELMGTPLCLAAATGRLEQVKLLLDAGQAVNDTVRRRSRYWMDDPDCWRGMTDHIVTPLYMALRNGHREVAEYLRARGGICYPEWEPEKDLCVGKGIREENGEPCICGGGHV